MFKNKKVAVCALIALLVAASSWGVDFYAGASLGYGNKSLLVGWDDLPTLHGFSITPYMGILPGAEKSFALHLDLSMKIASYKYKDATFVKSSSGKNLTGQGNFSFNPELYALFNFTKVPYVKPYIGAGIGVNFENNIETDRSAVGFGSGLSLGAKFGANCNIPNTNFDIGLDFKLKYIVLNTGEFDVCLGGKYRFVKK